MFNVGCSFLRFSIISGPIKLIIPPTYSIVGYKYEILEGIWALYENVDPFSSFSIPIFPDTIPNFRALAPPYF